MTQDVLFEEVVGNQGNVGIITLNRPQALNSLNQIMIEAMTAQLMRWSQQADIKAVCIRAVPGRAFCAGGDLRMTYTCMTDDPLAASKNFFGQEYALNRLIHHYPKPYIALLDGITMGGGVGVSIHGSHRVATDKLVFAMPETGIGFFPDVGGTYFLPRLENYLGFYLGLTGARLAADDCVALGLVQVKIEAAALPLIIDAIAQFEFTHDAVASVTACLQSFQHTVAPSALLASSIPLADCFKQSSMEAVINALQHADDALCQQALEELTKKSPLSLKVTLRAFQQALHLDFDACMAQEYQLSHCFVQGHDFREGIRAVIIDKDQTPRWQPANLVDVTDGLVERYFNGIEHI